MWEWVDGLDGMAVSAIVRFEKFSTFLNFSNIKYTVGSEHTEELRNCGISDEEKQSKYTELS